MLLLSYYNLYLPITAAADPSNYGDGATLSHIFSYGSEKTVAHASRILTSTEKNYSQIEKVFGQHFLC